MFGTRRAVGLAAALVFAIAACNGTAATTAPTAKPAATAAPATAAPATAAPATATPAPVATPAGTIKIGLITKFPVDFYDTMVDAAKTWAATQTGVQLLLGQGKSGTDDEGEIAAIESMISQGVQGIAITPTSPNLQTELQKAVDAGIKVVLIDNDIPAWTGKSSVVATDNLAGGKLAGQWLKDHLTPGGTIAVLQGVLGNPSLDARVTGMLASLGTAATVVATTPTDCDQTKGLNAAQDILTAHSDVTAIYGACGPPITGALQAIKNANIPSGKITVVGFDASPDEVNAIAAGDEAASVAQFPAKMGSLGMSTLLDAVNGKTVSPNVDTGTLMVTKDNAGDFGATATPAPVATPAGTIKIGLITKFPVDFYDTMVDAAKTWAATQTGVQLLLGQGKSGTDDEGEIAAIESMISQGVQGIAITPTSPNLQTELQKAVDAGIKVVLIDNDIPAWTGKSSVVATDNLAGGKLAGQWLKDHLTPGGTIAVLQGVLGNPSLDARVTGMLETLGTAATVVAKSPTDCDQTKGLNAAQDILTAHPDVTAIYGACGPPITGAIQAIKNANIAAGKITVVGFDASPDEVNAIAAGDEAASVAQFPAKMGSLGMSTLLDAVNGKTVSPNVDTGTLMVTKDNAGDFK